MEPVRREIDEAAENVVRFYQPDEPLSAAAEEALRRRTLEEHQAAIAIGLCATVERGPPRRVRSR